MVNLGHHAFRTAPIRRSVPAGLCRGFTLLELILVILIMGVILGVGVGGFASFDPGSRAARGLVANILRQARNDAVAHRAPSRVRFSPEDRTIEAQGYVVAGTWSFESDALTGANGANGEAREFGGSPLTRDGFIGRALDMEKGGRGSVVAFDISDDPIFDLRRGFRLVFAVRAATIAEAQMIDLGEVLVLNLRRDGSVEVTAITRRVDEMGRARAGEKVQMRSTPGVIEPERWVEIEVRYDLRRLVVLANGVPVAERAETRELWKMGASFKVGGGRSLFAGRVDEVVLAVARTADVIRLPSSAGFAGSVPFEVRFDEGGRLDPIAHGGPVTVTLEYDDGTTESLEVLRVGTVE